MQTTIKYPVSCCGIGVHSGRKTQLTLIPTNKPNMGIIFVRTDITGIDNYVPALYSKVLDTALATSITNDAKVKISTIEHLMAALHGCGIDNVIVEVDGPEIPIMDGSSKPFVFMVEYAGIKYFNTKKKHLKLHSDLVIGQQNLTAGLVELGVGLIPGWGGVKEMFIRHNDSKDKLYQNLNNIIHQTKSSSADYFANDFGVNCEVNMNVGYILEQAINYDIKQIAIKEATSRNEPNIQLPTLDLMFELNMEDYTPLQIEVLEFMQRIIDMKVVSEQNLLDLEREKFLNLASTPLCLEKLQQFV